MFTVIGLCGQQKSLNHWSFTIEVGCNKFDGDVKQSYNDIIPNSKTKVSLGASSEYTINPIWGIGTEFYYLPLRAVSPNYSFSSTMFHLNPYVSVDILNLFGMPHSRWGVWTSLGGGIAHYNSTLYKNDQKFDEIKDGWALTVPVGLSIEYNISKSFALGLKIEYRSHNKDNLEGTNKKEADGGENFKGVTNDFVSLGTLMLRWKAGKNSIKEHVRNIDPDIKYKELLAIANGAKSKADSTEKKLKDSGIDDLRPKVDQISKTIADGPDDDKDGVPNYRDKEPNTPKGSIVDFYGRTIPGFEAKGPYGNAINSNDMYYFKSDGTDSDNDGVPDNRDKEPNTPRNTPVDFWGRTIGLNEINGFGSVFFDFDKTNLDAEAMKTIESVAEKMKSIPTLMVEIRGYCDYLGSSQYNKELSLRRSLKVKAELVYMYGISPSRIITNGRGKILEPKSAYRFNRRCNFLFDQPVN